MLLSSQHTEKSKIMTLSDELQTFLKTRGADLVGFADLHEIPSNIRANLPSGISFGVALNPRIVSELREGPTPSYYEEYKRVNNLLDILGQSTVEFLTRNGSHARSLSTTYGHNPATLSTPLPHKTVATRAGLGWIGKCALLITREFGSAVRINTVLTDAEFVTGQPVNESMCGECTACIDICPVHAPSGLNWQPDISRDALYNAFACRSVALELAMKKTGHREAICGRCIAACPWTENYTGKYDD
jgi:epoxyqueuosine reductase